MPLATGNLTTTAGNLVVLLSRATQPEINVFAVIAISFLAMDRNIFADCFDSGLRPDNHAKLITEILNSQDMKVR